MTLMWSLNGVPVVEVTYHITAGTIRATDEQPDDPIPEGEDVGDDPVREPIGEDDPRVGHEPVEE